MGSKQTVKTKDFVKVIKHWGLTKRRTRGSHESWLRTGMLRPAIVQATSKEIYERAFTNNLKAIGETVEEFFKTLDSL